MLTTTNMQDIFIINYRLIKFTKSSFPTDEIEYKYLYKQNKYLWTLSLILQFYILQISINNQMQQQKPSQTILKSTQLLRSVTDIIHGTIFFEPLIWEFIDTPHFQRLRKIKQLGCLEYVYPSAKNTRFQHSIGTAYLARTFLNFLIVNNPTNYSKVNLESARRTITIAGLLHDVGHGPFSHAFDSQIVPKIQRKGENKLSKWSHEQASELLFDHMIKYLREKRRNEGKTEKDQLILEEHEIKRIKALIKGQPKICNDQRKWQFEIISNKINGIDVDKFDYFRRDAFYLGAKHIYINHDLLFKQARIIRNEICYPSESVETVYNIFHSRYKLYKNYYFDTVNKSIQKMVCDILDKTKHVFKFKEACEQLYTSPDKYIKLTDSVIETIENIYERMVANNSLDIRFEEAVAILKRIRTRDLYRFVKELNYYIREKEDSEALQYFEKHLKAEKIIKQVSQMAGVNPEDLFVSISDVGFGFKQKNPMKRVGFFRKEQQVTNWSKKMEEHDIQNLSMLYNSVYVERSIKIFIKRNDEKLFDKVDEAFTKFRSKFNEDCRRELKKDMGVNYIFEGKGGITPARNNYERATQQQDPRPNPFDQK